VTGPALSPPHWARIQLVQGTSSAGLWDLSSHMNEARVAVGSMPPANWVVQGPTVAEQHFEFYWDGVALWISPPQGGEVTVDGERVQTWRQLVGRCRLEFGGAAMLVETSASVAAVGAEQGAPAQQAPPPPPAPTPGYTGPPPPMAPGPSTARSLDAAPVLSSDAIQPLQGDSTQMLEMSDLALAPLPSPSFGGVALGGAAASSPFEFESGPATQVFDPAAAGIDMLSALAAPPAPAVAPSAGHPGLKSSAMSTDVLPGRAQASGGPSSRFKAPPPPVEKKEPEGVSKRTIGLAALVLVMAVGLLVASYVRRNQRSAALQASRVAALAGEEDRAREAIAQVSAQAQELIAERVAEEAILISQAEEAGARCQARAEATIAERDFSSMSEEDFEAVGGPEGATRTAYLGELQRQAAVVAGRNDHRTALGLYLLLAREKPRDTNYPRIVDILRQKLRCQGDPCQ
jgi:hypothetical protein